MTRDDELRIVRGAFAKQIAHAARVSDPRVEKALAELHREDFLFPGPWQLNRFGGGYQQTPDDDPTYLYQDVPVAILPAKGLNNGQPSFLISLLAMGRLREGERALHIGAGMGYYTAVMSYLAGAAGRITAVELEPELASRATANLAQYSNVSVIQGNASAMRFDTADVIYVNAGATRPAEAWLSALALGGRMILPLTVGYIADGGHSMTRGLIVVIERQADHFSARCMMTTFIYPCEGMRDEASEKALAAALEKGGAAKVTRLRLSDDVPEERAWLRAPGWSLTYE
jgi:protein-L-isoaspartate(D-aspartate) O-methyltransferase